MVKKLSKLALLYTKWTTRGCCITNIWEIREFPNILCCFGQKCQVNKYPTMNILEIPDTLSQ